MSLQYIVVGVKDISVPAGTPVVPEEAVLATLVEMDSQGPPFILRPGMLRGARQAWFLVSQDPAELARFYACLRMGLTFLRCRVDANGPEIFIEDEEGVAVA